MRQAVLKFFTALFLCLSPLGATADPAFDCAKAGPGAGFCAGITFKHLARHDSPGISFWLHKHGFLSKLVVQSNPMGRADQAEIETQILGLVQTQVGQLGGTFEFIDIASAQVDGVPYGTLSYTLRDASAEKSMLHSYIAARGVIVQVISQIGLSRASINPDDLARAHGDALRAVRLLNTDPEA